MKIALIGQGAMGQLVGALASAAGYEVALTLSSQDAARSALELAEELRGLDVAIDFSIAQAVLKNVEACALSGVPLVEGTTGWRDEQSKALEIVRAHDGALVYGANFSIGVNLFYRLVAYAGELFQTTEDYAPFIEEAHHSRKRDAPSGTALRLKELLAAQLPWDIPVTSTRAGHIPGTHRVGFDSISDQITLTHTARSREGFAQGALAAARWIKGRRGVYEFSEALDEILKTVTSDE
ncbi:MAG TPA: dihydrodipicolinate reductase C-terminal domain-containing protein [Pyrinomonadaceae bacterium]|jgi:4-hydroxy-tetrahydrodipicolinate reductase|nr:dihydrodipicolinate reductase C-terminal domain-containing protein [Pyrinomonadaceae bacterium]